MHNNKSLSIVTTLYKSASTIREFHRRSEEAAFALEFERVEFVYVDDGSPDESVEIVSEIAKNRNDIVLAKLSRNFGHHQALMHGLSKSTGDLVFLIDSDLDESPELIQVFLERLIETDSDVVYGFQQKRRGGWVSRFIGNSYWRMFKSFSSLEIPKNICTVRLMSREYVNALSLYEERELSIGGVFALAGFRQQAIGITKLENSASTYSLQKRAWHAINSLVSFSDGPLIGVFILGIVVSFFAIVIIVATLIWVLILNNGLSGWNSLIISIWLIGGFVITSLGVIGLYVGKIFTETKNRPRTIERKI